MILHPPSIVCSDDGIDGGIARGCVAADAEHDSGVLALDLVFRVVIVPEIQPAQGLQHVAVAVLDPEVRAARLGTYGFPGADACAGTGRGRGAAEAVEDLAEQTADAEA